MAFSFHIHVLEEPFSSSKLKFWKPFPEEIFFASLGSFLTSIDILQYYKLTDLMTAFFFNIHVLESQMSYIKENFFVKLLYKPHNLWWHFWRL